MPNRGDSHIRNVRNQYSGELAKMTKMLRQRLTRPNVATAGSELAEFFSRYRRQHGRGPTWREAAKTASVADLLPAMPEGMPLRYKPYWDSAAMNIIFRRLRATGWIQFSDESRSFRPGPRFEGG